MLTFVRRAALRALAALRNWWRRGFPLPPFVVVEGDGVAPFVRVSCPTCNEDVNAPYADVKILVYPTNAEWVGFICPTCKHDGMVPLPSLFSKAVHAAGFPVVKMPGASASNESPLTEDDLIAFGLALESAQEISV